MKLIKKFVTMICMVCMMSSSLVVHASENGMNDNQNQVMNYSVNDEIGFVLYKSPEADKSDVSQINLLASKKYTSDSYTGYFYYKSNNDKISEHTFTAKFSYDGSIATCYDTSNSIVMIDNDTNLHPKAENEGRNNLTPTQVYGYITFVLYNTDDSVNTEVSVKIYCNQDGDTWVNRQG